jgi:hypothetical protein
MKIKIVPLIIILIAHLLIKTSAKAQAPQSFNYQAVARDASGAVLGNQAVSFRISLLQGSATGTSSYTEIHAVTTNQLGLVNFAIGGGTVVNGNFATINWAQGPYFAQIELDANNSGTYVLMSTTQLLSVPYAQYAEKSGNPTLHAGSGIVIQNDSIVNTGDVSNTNEIQTLHLINDTLKLSQTNGGIPVNNIGSQIPSGGYLETTSSVAPAGYSFTGKIEAENCKQLIKQSTFVDINFTDTTNYGSVAGNYSFVMEGNNIYGAACYLSNNQVVKKFICYNSQTNTWNTLPSFSKERAGFAMVALNNKIYIFGGDSILYQNNNHYSVPYVEEYDITANSWIQKANMPTSRFFANSKIINNKVYVMGGATSYTSQSNYVNSNEVFDPSTNTWTQKTPAPTNFNGLSNGTVSNTSIYFSYTDINQTILKITNYNIITDTWTAIPTPINDYDLNPYTNIALASISNRLFGASNNQNLSTVFEFDSITQSWNKKFDSEHHNSYLYTEPDLLITIGSNLSTWTYNCSIYTTENGTLLCKTFLPLSTVANLKGNGCLFFVVSNGSNKIGLYKYEFPHLVYKYVKN